MQHGNEAAEQHQADAYGQVLDLLYLYDRPGGTLSDDMRRHGTRGWPRFPAARWHEPDAVLRPLHEIAADRKSPAGARTMAVKALTELSGIDTNQDHDNRPLHMLPAAELETRARKAQASLDALDRTTIAHQSGDDAKPSRGFFDRSIEDRQKRAGLALRSA